MIQVGIFAKTFPRPTLEETLDAVVSHRLACVQFNMTCAGLPSLPDQVDANLLEHIHTEMARRGLVIAALSGTYNMAHPDPKARERGLQRLRVLAAACRALGTSIITLCTGSRHTEDMWHWHAENASPQAWHDLSVSIERALSIAEETHITLAFEPEWTTVVNTAHKSRSLLDSMQSPRLKVVIDPLNLVRPGDEVHMPAILEEAFELLGEHLVLAHAKDRPVEQTSKGLLDYDHYLHLLRSVAFDGSLILHGLEETQVDSVLSSLHRKIQGVSNDAFL